MSIVAVHGPQTFGSKALVEKGPVQAVPNPANGLQWDFRLDGSTTRVNADFAWTFPPNGTPTPQNVADPALVTYATAGAKTAQVVVTGAGTGANPYPPAGTYTIDVTAVTGTGLPGTSLRGAEEEIDEGDIVPEPSQGPSQVYAEEVTEEIPVGYDPAAHTVDEIKEYLTEHPDQLEEIYDAEMAGKARATLVTWLEEQMPFDPGAYTIDDVKQYVTDNPSEREAVLTAEQQGKARSTLLTWLEEQPA